MAICLPTGQTIFTSKARWEGRIGFTEKGENGFGFDPIFVLPDSNLTAAEISEDEKNQISHRGQAFRQVVDFLQTELKKTV